MIGEQEVALIENRKILNKMRQLLGRQRKEEEYLEGERTYKPRVK